MDTKSKNIKRYPLWIKALCVVLSVLCCLGVVFSGLYVVTAAQTMDLRSGKLTGIVPASFTQTAMFREIVQGDVSAIAELVTYPQQTKRLTDIQAQRDTVIESQVQRYLREKAAIIRAEIYFVATHYTESEDGDYYYEAYMRDFSTTEPVPTTAVQQNTETSAAQDTGEDTSNPTTAAPESAPAEIDDMLDALPKLTVDERAQYNVRYCQQLVNTVTGLDWLQYESLVRSNAFEEKSFSPDFDTLGSSFSSYDYHLNETQIRGELDESFDAIWSMQKENIDASKSAAESRLRDTVNMRYRAESADGTVYTNLEDGENPDMPYTVRCKDGKATADLADGPSAETIAAIAQDAAVDLNGNPFTLALYFAQTIQPGDRYAEANARYEAIRRFPPAAVIGVCAACAIGMLCLLIVLLCLCGHKTGAEGITLAFIDRMPTDVHFLLTGAVGVLLGCLGLFCYEAYDELQSIKANGFGWIVLYVCLPAVFCAAWLALLEWLTSTVRIKKAGQSFFRRFILWKVLRLVFRAICFILGKVKQTVLYLLEKPKKIRYIFILVTAVYVVASFVWIGITAGGLEMPGVALFGFVLLSTAYVLFHLRYLRTLDRIIELSSDRTALPIPDTDRMPPALRTLAENMSFTQNELNKAVAQAVRNERTKTELITNVSHDLKTPLTSVISYVDLLKQCDITDETAKGYLDILDEKSANLKRLIEDLIEASKVSTGNVTLNRVPLNLSELATQAVVEATPELEARGLEIKFAQSDDAPIIFADSGKTYRILENLLSNVKKYAADHSRVYIRIWEDAQFGVFEIKNVSAEPLDIDPQELLERFVRGDRSRTNDGNGLGLSIAQQLCVLQDGRLDIQIDGDLFKAAVYLPKQKSEEGSLQIQ